MGLDQEWPWCMVGVGLCLQGWSFDRLVSVSSMWLGLIQSIDHYSVAIALWDIFLHCYVFVNIVVYFDELHVLHHCFRHHWFFKWIIWVRIYLHVGLMILLNESFLLFLTWKHKCSCMLLCVSSSSWTFNLRMVFNCTGAVAGMIDIGTSWMADLRFGICPEAFWFNQEQCCWSSNETFYEGDNCSNVSVAQCLYVF